MCSYEKIREWQTRLALIKPNADCSACLELNLVVVDLVDLNTGAIINHDTIVTYDALSYAWGTTSPSIECICDGHTILLRDNLDSALKYLRQPQDERYVWIDFLCINQDDLVEKSIQIPRMRSIYAKASTVIVWLGESLAVGNIARHCNKNCGPDVETLTCSKHKEELWESILDYTWFRRTWVRQEVFAAGRLNVCSPYFSTTWELFVETLGTMITPKRTFSQEAVLNLLSLNQVYSSRGLQLLELLKQGKAFQASVPHDHVFSVFGMMSTPKHNTKASIPVTYSKTYDEICGDVTRFIIRESQSISILQWCPLQRDRSYAFNWPAVEVSCPVLGEVTPEIFCDRGSEFVKWFEAENPIREVSLPMPLENTVTFSISGQPVSRRPLMLYGRAWGILTGQVEKFLFYDSNGNFTSVSTYLVDHKTKKDSRTRSSSQEDVDEYRKFAICKRGSIRRVLGGILKEYEGRVGWECRGSVREGDIFVSLEPDLCNVLLRRCPRPDDLFEVVAWGHGMQVADIHPSAFVPVKDETAYYLAKRMNGDTTSTEEWRPNHAPGPRQLFKIR